jgi:hypothetical protein
MTVLSAKSQERLNAFLKLPGREGGDAPGFHAKIQAWALDPEHGGLPDLSGRSFANWLDNEWEQWTEEPERTVEDVLKGAVTQWCGGRTF